MTEHLTHTHTHRPSPPGANCSASLRRPGKRRDTITWRSRGMTDASQPAGSCSAAQRSLQWATNPGKAEGRSHMPLDSIQTLSSFFNRVDKQAKNCLQLWRERIYWWRNLSWLTNAKPLETEVFPGGSDSKASACNGGHPGLIHGLGRSLGEGNGYPF